MEPFTYRQGQLLCEGVPLEHVAERLGTPTLVYSTLALRANLARFRAAFADLDPRIAFAVKACGNLGVLRTLAQAGCGMCAVSGGEVERAWLSGVKFADVVFAGVGKSDEDLRAALDGLYSPLFQAGVSVAGRPPSYRGPIGCIVAESRAELERLARIASGMRVNARVAVRVNPEPGPDEPLDPASAPRRAAAAGSKFGLSAAAAKDLFDRFRDEPRVRPTGLHMHLGPSVHDLNTLHDAVQRLCRLAQALIDAGHRLDLIDIGGGFAAIGLSSRVPTPEDYARTLTPLLKPFADRGTAVVIEPGRAITASAGVLLVRVLDAKPMEDRTVLVGDVGLDAAARPNELDGFRVAWPIEVQPGQEPPDMNAQRLAPTGLQWVDIVGRSGGDDDILAQGRLIPPVQRGDVLAVFGAGAYALQIIRRASDHPLPGEALVDQYELTPIRTRRSLMETLAPELDAGYRA